MRKNGVKSVDELHRAATKALKKAVAKALIQHELAGVPAAIWRDGKVVYLSGRKSKRHRSR